MLGAPGNEELKTEAAKLMAAKLADPAAAKARVWLLTQLMRIGRAECVDAVAALVADKDPLVSDAACRALAANPTTEALRKLYDLVKANDNAKTKVALVNAIRYHGGSTCPLSILLRNADATVAVAAARAFGEVGPPAAVPNLLKVRLEARGEVRTQIDDACLRIADRLCKAGKCPEAAAIYKELNTPQEPRMIRLAALKGMLGAAGDGAAAMIIEALASSDAGARQVAVGHISRLSPAGAKTLADGLAKLPPAGQVALLGALGAQRVKAAMPAVLAATKSEDEGVRAAALRALAGVGDASVVPMLVETALKGGNPGGAAREALEATFAPGVDQKLLEIMKAAADQGQRCQLIEILDRRRAAMAVPALVEEAQSDNAELRRRAIGALGRLADAKDVTAMIRSLAKVKDAGERDEAERAITAVCNRIPDEAERAGPVLAAYQAAGGAEKAALLAVLGRIGGEKPLVLVRDALAGSDAALYVAAVRAVGNWPDMAVAEDLLKLAANGREPADRKAAIRGFARVISLRDDFLNDRKVAEEKLNLLKRAMPLTTTDEERGWLIERAANVRHVETLRFVAPYLDQPALAQRACRTVVDLAHHRDLREPNKAEFASALEKVINRSKDGGQVNRAEKYLAGEK